MEPATVPRVVRENYQIGHGRRTKRRVEAKTGSCPRRRLPRFAERWRSSISEVCCVAASRCGPKGDDNSRRIGDHCPESGCRDLAQHRAMTSLPQHPASPKSITSAPSEAPIPAGTFSCPDTPFRSLPSFQATQSHSESSRCQLRTPYAPPRSPLVVRRSPPAVACVPSRTACSFARSLSRRLCSRS